MLLLRLQVLMQHGHNLSQMGYQYTVTDSDEFLAGRKLSLIVSINIVGIDAALIHHQRESFIHYQVRAACMGCVYILHEAPYTMFINDALNLKRDAMQSSFASNIH
eukprot:6173032-Pleurochrysis_carterae.AAC.3